MTKYYSYTIQSSNGPFVLQMSVRNMEQFAREIGDVKVDKDEVFIFTLWEPDKSGRAKRHEIRMVKGQYESLMWWIKSMIVELKGERELL